MYKDEAANPPAIVCMVGKTELRYQIHAVEDLHAMLKKHGDWMPLGSADEQKPPQMEPLKHGAARPRTPLAVGTG